MVPPVGRTLRHLQLCRGKGILVVPDWPSAQYWPMLLGEFRAAIKGLLKVKGNKVLEHGYNSNSLLGSFEFRGNILAMFIDCS